MTVLGSGSRLIESALSTELARAHTLDRLVEGFFPIVDLDARPQRRASAIIEFGLPYVADAAVTRHVAAFLARHQSVAKEAVGDALIDGVALPDAVLLNGGVFRGQALADRMIDVLSRFRGDRGPVRVLDNDDPELAVARGAVFYGLARRGVGMKIGGGSARSYFLLLGDRSKKSDDGVDRAVCLLPRGAEEGEEVVLGERAFSLRLGQPVRGDGRARRAHRVEGLRERRVLPRRRDAEEGRREVARGEAALAEPAQLAVALHGQREVALVHTHTREEALDRTVAHDTGRQVLGDERGELALAVAMRRERGRGARDAGRLLMLTRSLPRARRERLLQRRDALS